MFLYAATTNPGKLRDFAHAAVSSPSIRIEPLPGLNTIPAPPEDEPTFEANARLKAIYYSLRAPNLLVLADDSGLEVAALDNAPGVRSARFAADLAIPAASDTPDNRNNAALLAALAAFPDPAARPVTAALSPSPAMAKSSHRRRHGRGPHPHRTARNRRLRLRPPLLPSPPQPHHVRASPRRPPRPQPPWPRPHRTAQQLSNQLAVFR